MDFYFGNSNLRQDRFLKKEIDSTADGCKDMYIRKITRKAIFIHSIFKSKIV